MLRDPQSAVVVDTNGNDNSSNTPLAEKVRLRFRKGGDLRFVSHHDLMSCFERMLRRANIPFRSTQGFHPKPRMVFALSLALGVLGHEEVVELELTELLSSEEVLHRLTEQCPPGLEFLRAHAIPRKITAQPRRVGYRLAVPLDLCTDVNTAITDLLGQTECFVERTRPKPCRYNLRPFIHHLQLHDGFLEMSLWVTPTGMARPNEVLLLLNLANLPIEGSLLERTQLELKDELTETDTGPQELQAQPLSAPPAKKAQPAQPTALLPGPLSFET